MEEHRSIGAGGSWRYLGLMFLAIGWVPFLMASFISAASTQMLSGIAYLLSIGMSLGVALEARGLVRDAKPAWVMAIPITGLMGFIGWRLVESTTGNEWIGTLLVIGGVGLLAVTVIRGVKARLRRREAVS